ncbi:MAG: hypothetical protein M0R03_15915 [Novosphingobium sp.]|nr:hypothetical protein [Novosphingobium sp.]
MKIKDMNCYNCIHIDYYEKECFEDNSPAGYFCHECKKYRDDMPQDKEFLKKAKPRCFSINLYMLPFLK